MPRTIDVDKLKAGSIHALDAALNRLRNLGWIGSDEELTIYRWTAAMTAVEVHAIWERYAERRLVAALNHYPDYFIEQEEIKGVSRISSGLAFYVVRGGSRYFDFRSSSELLKKGDALLGQPDNPFRGITKHNRDYLDALAAIRNLVVHDSSAATASFKRLARSVYAVQYPGGAGEFLCAVEHRAGQPGRGKSRLSGLIAVVMDSVNSS
ncbi:MAG TPA: hypothetical protein VFB45_06840 [Pseudolabrys sp.]|nr:hypothetical protein [Pseudolabrys sp.]